MFVGPAMGIKELMTSLCTETNVFVTYAYIINRYISSGLIDELLYSSTRYLIRRQNRSFRIFFFFCNLSIFNIHSWRVRNKNQIWKTDITFGSSCTAVTMRFVCLMKNFFFYFFVLKDSVTHIQDEFLNAIMHFYLLSICVDVDSGNRIRLSLRDTNVLLIIIQCNNVWRRITDRSAGSSSLGS